MGKISVTLVYVQVIKYILLVIRVKFRTIVLCNTQLDRENKRNFYKNNSTIGTTQVVM